MLNMKGALIYQLICTPVGRVLNSKTREYDRGDVIKCIYRYVDESRLFDSRCPRQRTAKKVSSSDAARATAVWAKDANGCSNKSQQ